MNNIDLILYHYTDSNGLLGIMKNHCLWATHFNYLNDMSELQLFWESFNTDEMERKFNPNILDKRWRRSLLEFYSMILSNNSPVTPFLFSFCNDNGDRLSQWRGYGNGDGYSIGFSFKDLNKCVEDEFDKHQIDIMDITECYYLSGVFTESMYNKINIFFKYYNDYIDVVKRNSNLQTIREKLLDESMKVFYPLLVGTKHQGFEEEKEYRIIALIPTRDNLLNGKKNPYDVQYRIRYNKLIPYIELFKDYGTLPINRIVVGPSQNSLERRDNLESILVKYGISAIRVDVSNIPYRG